MSLLCHSDERILRGLPASRAISEETEVAQARHESEELYDTVRVCHSEQSEESYQTFIQKIQSSYGFLIPSYSVGKSLRRKNGVLPVLMASRFLYSEQSVVKDAPRDFLKPRIAEVNSSMLTKERASYPYMSF